MGLCTGGTGFPKLDGDPRSIDPRTLWNAVEPGLLAGAPHHQQIAPPQIVGNGSAARPWLEQKAARGAEGEQSDDCICGIRQTIAVKRHTVGARAIAGQTDPTERSAVVRREACAGLT